MKVCRNKDFCGITLATQKDILKFNQNMKSYKTTCTSYADRESFIT